MTNAGLLESPNNGDDLQVRVEPPRHLCRLTAPGEVKIRAPLAADVLAVLGKDFTQQDLVDTISQCEVIFKDAFSGTRSVLKMSDATVLKISPIDDGTREYSALEYLEKHCSDIPAPTPLGMLEINGKSLIFMSYIPGETLEKVWPSLSRRQKIIVQANLDQILPKLRSYELQPGALWGGLGGEGCIDSRFNVRQSKEAIRNSRDFESFYFSNPKYGGDIWITLLRQLYGNMRLGYSAGHSDCVLTHADLRPANIMVEFKPDSDIAVSGIIDWECSGFYPAWWETVKAMTLIGDGEESDWLEYLPLTISHHTYVERLLLDRIWSPHVW